MLKIKRYGKYEELQSATNIIWEFSNDTFIKVTSYSSNSRVLPKNGKPIGITFDIDIEKEDNSLIYVGSQFEIYDTDKNIQMVATIDKINKNTVTARIQ